MQEFYKRVKIGLALVVGLFAGKFAAQTVGHHASEFFIGAFGLGVIFTQGIFWLIDKLSEKTSQTLD